MAAEQLKATALIALLLLDRFVDATLTEERQRGRVRLIRRVALRPAAHAASSSGGGTAARLVRGKALAKARPSGTRTSGRGFHWTVALYASQHGDEAGLLHRLQEWATTLEVRHMTYGLVFNPDANEDPR